jgi:hypothetical protein
LLICGPKRGGEVVRCRSRDGVQKRVADFGVIAAVFETLQSVLTTAASTLPGPPTVEISDLTGTISTTPARITIFLSK